MARSEGASNSRDFGSEGFRREKSKRDGSTSNVITEKSIFYRDVALIRFKDENVQVVTEIGFMNTFNKRQNDPEWANINCIQTNIKSKIGCGVPYIIKFYAPIDVNDKEAEIIYDFKQFGTDEDLIRSDEYQYCLKQCYKMAYYI